MQRTYLQRGRAGSKELKRKREAFQTEQQLYSNINAAAYHRQRLQELLQDAEDQHDHHRIAMVSAALLAAQDFKHLPGQDKTPGGLVADYFQQVGAAGYEALYHQASFDELKRYLRKLQNHQSGPEDAEVVLLETTYLLAEHGEYQEAYDLLDSYADRSTHHFQRHAVCGFLRHAQVTELMQKTAAGMASASGSRAEPIQPLNLFQFDDQVWTRCGQQLQEFWTSAETHLKEALKLQPAALEQGSLLAQLYMMRGQPEDALEVATALRPAAPHDADAHGLFILLKEAQGVDVGSKQEVAEAYLNLLQCDPAAFTAVEGLMHLHGRLPVSLAVLTEALALHLDVAAGEHASAQQCWLWLADVLTAAAKAVLQHEEQQHQVANAAAGEPVTGTNINQQEAWTDWQALQELLPVQRYWWKTRLFRKDAVMGDAASAVPSSHDDHDLLTAQAVCCALMFSSASEDDINDYLADVQRQLELAGQSEMARDVVYSSKLAKHIHKAQRRRALVHVGTPFNKPLAKFGLVPSLPDVWWYTFPFKRRADAAGRPAISR